MPDILESPDFAVLNEAHHAAIEKAVADPDYKERLLLSSVLALWQEARAARVNCTEVCQKGIHNRLSRLERFRAWLIGLGAGAGGLSALVGAIYGALKVLGVV